MHSRAADCSCAGVQAIKHDLPPTPNGFVECWSTIIDILRKQKEDPSYCMPVQLPQGTAATQSKGCGSSHHAAAFCRRDLQGFADHMR